MWMGKRPERHASATEGSGRTSGWAQKRLFFAEDFNRAQRRSFLQGRKSALPVGEFRALPGDAGRNIGGGCTT